MSDLSNITRIYGAFQVCADPSKPTKVTGFLFPNLTTAQANALVAATPSLVQDSFVYYDTDQKSLILRSNGTWTAISTGPLSNDLVLPNKTSSSEGFATNRIGGFTYYNSNSPNNIRTYVGVAGAGGTFANVPTSINIATGAGLDIGNSPVVLPNGISSQVEVLGNQQDGFVYYSTDYKAPRIYYDSNWHYMGQILTKFTTINGLASYNMTISDNYLIIFTHAGGSTMYLPTTGISSGKVFYFKDATGDSPTNRITIDGNGKTIDGATSVILQVSGGVIRLVYDSSETGMWHIF